jgi:hypothetical protein
VVSNNLFTATIIDCLQFSLCSSPEVQGLEKLNDIICGIMAKRWPAAACCFA